MTSKTREEFKLKLETYFKIHPFIGNPVVVHPYGSKTLQALSEDLAAILEEVLEKQVVRLPAMQTSANAKFSKSDKLFSIAVSGDDRLFFCELSFPHTALWEVTSLAPEGWVERFKHEAGVSGGVFVS